MLELLPLALAGFVSYLLLTLRWDMRESPGTGFLVCSLVALVGLVIAGLDALGHGDFASIARLLVFYLGFAIGHATCQEIRRRRAKRQHRAAANEEARFRELSVRAASPQFELHVTGASRLSPGVALVLAAGIALALAAGLESIAWALGGAVTLVWGLLLLMATVPTLGRPKISMTSLGFKTPLTPFVPWKDVQGISLEHHKLNGRPVFHRLHFLIPSLPLQISRFALFHRLVHPLRSKAGKQQLQVVLERASEHPQAVYRVAQQLWTRSTGRSHLWMPEMPEAFNLALRRMDEASGLLQAEMLAGLPPPKPGDARDPLRIFNESSATISAEMDRRTRALHWLALAAMAVLLCFLAAQFVLLHLG